MFLKELKRVEIILEGEHIDSLKRILEKIEIGGYTIFHNLEGKGAKGYHEGRLLFNEEDALVMLMTVVEEEKMEAIVKGLQPFFEKHSGRIFVSEARMALYVS